MSALVDAAALAKSWLATLGMMAGQGTLLVIVALVLTCAGKLRPAWQAGIWLVVALKLALPWTPAMPFSLSDLIAGLSDRGGEVVVVTATAAATTAAPALSAGGLGWLLLAAIWTTGALFVLTRALLAQHRTVVAARRAPAAPDAALAIVRDHRPRVRLVVGDASVGPHVVGLLRPIIVVPPALLDDPPLLRAALLHELAHVRRRDALGRYIQIIAATLMWWFPLVRLVQRRLDLAREAACDAWALETSALSRPAYARLLVRMAALRGAAAPALAQHALDARVAAVLGPPVRARIGVAHRFVLAAWIVVALGGARTASARGQEPVCRYTPEMADALLAAYPEADVDGDGYLSRDEACELQAALTRTSRAPAADYAFSASSPDPELATLLAEPLCCNCDGPEVISSPEVATCQNVEGVER
jgi:beta-lactamase regulating signal transducer with metallopeptidase domain